MKQTPHVAPAFKPTGTPVIASQNATIYPPPTEVAQFVPAAADVSQPSSQQQQQPQVTAKPLNVTDFKPFVPTVKVLDEEKSEGVKEEGS